MFLFDFVRYHWKIFFHLIVIVTLYDGFDRMVVCIYLYFFCVHVIQSNTIHSLHYCLHSTRCVYEFFFPSNVSNWTNWFSDRLLQFTDKRFNFFCCLSLAAKLLTRASVHNTVMTSKFTLYFPNFTWITPKFTHTFENVLQCSRIIFLLLVNFFVVVVSVDSA